MSKYVLKAPLPDGSIERLLPLEVMFNCTSTAKLNGKSAIIFSEEIVAMASVLRDTWDKPYIHLHNAERPFNRLQASGKT
jgi:hypothetical protein